MDSSSSDERSFELADQNGLDLNGIHFEFSIVWRNPDFEAGGRKKSQMIVRRIPTWLLLFLLNVGLVASIVGF